MSKTTKIQDLFLSNEKKWIEEIEGLSQDMYNKRIITIDDEIDVDLIRTICNVLLKWEIEDKDIPIKKRVPIKMQIATVGGDISIGLFLIEIMESMTTPIITIVTGATYSMGSLIACAGHKRYMFKSGTLLHHYGRSTADSISLEEYIKKLQDKANDIVCKHSKLTKEEYVIKIREEWYMFADEAKQYGLIDGIIGEDISLLEVYNCG